VAGYDSLDVDRLPKNRGIEGLLVLEGAYLNDFAIKDVYHDRREKI
jgi:hypothetical protein